jgi:hypothetical protein
MEGKTLPPSSFFALRDKGGTKRWSEDKEEMRRMKRRKGQEREEEEDKKDKEAEEAEKDAEDKKDKEENEKTEKGEEEEETRRIRRRVTREKGAGCVGDKEEGEGDKQLTNYFRVQTASHLHPSLQRLSWLTAPYTSLTKVALQPIFTENTVSRRRHARATL